jgi:hypothetical protein
VSVKVGVFANTSYRLVVHRTDAAAGQWEREVRYQVEGGDLWATLPVRYEVVIDPTL